MKGLLKGLTIGLVVGASVALLYAPKSGKALRKSFKELIHDRKRIKDSLENLHSRVALAAKELPVLTEEIGQEVTESIQSYQEQISPHLTGLQHHLVRMKDTIQNFNKENNA